MAGLIADHASLIIESRQCFKIETIRNYKGIIRFIISIFVKSKITLRIIYKNTMLPANFHYVAKCPKCKARKKLLCLASGNTFGAQLWSDAMRHAPMMPSLSQIQKCEECGHFFFLGDVKLKTKSGYGGETGQLSYEDMKQAFLLLENEEMRPDHLFTLRLEFVHRFNDAFREMNVHHYGDEKTSMHPDERNETDWKLHRSNLKGLIEILGEDDMESKPLVAEFYRESGDFENCLRVLNSFETDNEFLKKLRDRMALKAKHKNCLVFEIINS